MPRPLVGTITIGQAPRSDVTPILESHLPAATSCLHVGVLDGLAPDEIAGRFGYRAGNRLLVTRLLDGTSVRLDGARVEGAVRTLVQTLESQGCGVIVVLCTGVFHGLETRAAWLVEPDRVIPPLLKAIVGGRALGVMVPDAAQVTSEAGKWGAMVQPPIYAAASPYAHDVAALRVGAATLRERGTAAIVLDCIGYTEFHRQVAVEASGLPVLLSNAIAARVTAELVSSWGA
ncbi:MAG: AroM family protein [Gemmatimonadaceae bacterium]|nr:AroM family protein [Gemmatimonadaceae bacterium]